MGTIIQLHATTRGSARDRETEAARPCEVVIFPGVRIERHELDLAHRVVDSLSGPDFDGVGGGRRPRKTS
jgi:hypothetical protein